MMSYYLVQNVWNHVRSYSLHLKFKAGLDQLVIDTWNGVYVIGFYVGHSTYTCQCNPVYLGSNNLKKVISTNKSRFPQEMTVARNKLVATGLHW